MRVMPAVMLFLLVAATAAESQVRNAELGYSLTLPDGFTDFPEARAHLPVGAGYQLRPIPVEQLQRDGPVTHRGRKPQVIGCRKQPRCPLDGACAEKNRAGRRGSPTP